MGGSLSWKFKIPEQRGKIKLSMAEKAKIIDGESKF